MKVKKQDLMDALNRVKPGLAVNEVIEQSTHFVFDGKTVRTYNDHMTIMAEIETGVAGAVLAILMLQLVQKMKTDDLEITQSESEILVKGGKTEAGLRLEDEVRLPEIDYSRVKEWRKLPENFSQGVKECLFSASRNLMKPVLCCMNVSKDVVESCDNYRASRKRMSGRVREPFLLPVFSAEHLVKYDPKEYCLDESWIHFRENGLFISCRRSEEKYPSLDHLFQVEGEEVKLPETLAESVDMAKVMAESQFDQDRLIELSFEESKLVCKGEGSMGWVKETIRMRYKGPEIRVCVHPSFLEQVLKGGLNEVVIGSNIAKFFGPNFEHSVCLVETK